MDTDRTRSSSDEQLIDRLRNDDIEAFDTIVVSYRLPLEEFAQRMTRDADAAEDLVQDVFVRLWELRATLDVRGTLRSYLFGSVRNHALMALRRTKIEDAWTADFLHAVVSPGASAETVPPDEALRRGELAAALQRALETLSPRVRHVALLRWRDKLSRAEIAAALGTAVPTVSNQLTIAAQALRRLLADQTE